MAVFSLLLNLLAASELDIVDTAVVDVVKTATEPFSPFIVFFHSIRSNNVVHAWSFFFLFFCSTRFTTWEMWSYLEFLVRVFFFFFFFSLSFVVYSMFVSIKCCCDSWKFCTHTSLNLIVFKIIDCHSKCATQDSKKKKNEIWKKHFHFFFSILRNRRIMMSDIIEWKSLPKTT